MSKSLHNNFGSGNKGCCSSKSLFNFDGSTLTTIPRDRSLEQYLNSLPPPEGTNESDLVVGPGPGDDVVIIDGIPDPLEVNNANVFNLLQAKNVNVTGTFSVGGGSIEIFNNMISSFADIIINPGPGFELQINPNLTVLGDYTHLDTIETRIFDRVPTIGYCDPMIVAPDNDDRGFQFDYVIEEPINSGIFQCVTGFIGYDKDRTMDPKNGRFVFWKRALIDGGVGGTDQNYERAGGNELNEIDLDVIYTTQINNPDYKIGGMDFLDLSIIAQGILFTESNLQDHKTTNVNYDVIESEIHSIGSGIATGRFLVKTEDPEPLGNVTPIGGKSKIDLNSTGIDGGPGLFLYHPTLVDITSCDPSGKVSINSECNIDLIAVKDVNITASQNIIFNSGQPINFNDQVQFNDKITAKQSTNEVTANCLTFIDAGLNRSIITTTPNPPVLTRPSGNAGILYYDENIDAIRGVTLNAVAGDILVYNGVDLTWASSSTSLQSAYSAGAALTDFGVIELNNTVGKMLIKDNNVGPSAINGILFQITQQAAGLAAGANLFSVDNNPADDKNIKIGGNLSMEGSVINTILFGINVRGMICQTTGVEFVGTSALFLPPINPATQVSGAEPNRTVWYDIDQNRLKIGHAGTNRPFALSPSTVSGSNRLVKITSALNANTHLLADTGLASNAIGELTVPTRLIATSSMNTVASDRLIFDNTNPPKILNTPEPVGPGGVIYFNGANIVGVTDIAMVGDVLFYNGVTPVWEPAGNIFGSNLQNIYDGSNPALIELNNTNGRILIKDNDIGANSINGILFQITEAIAGNGPGNNLFSIDNSPSDDKNIKIGGNLSMEGSVTTFLFNQVVKGMICQTTGVEFLGTSSSITIIIFPFPPIIIPIPAINPATEVSGAVPNRTVWYDDDQSRLKIGFSGSNRPFALSPNSVGGSNRLLKVTSPASENSHILDDTGLSSPAIGELTVPVRLIATSSSNNVNADRLVFAGTTRILSGPPPTGNGGVLYYNGANIRGVTDPPIVGDVLHYNGVDVEWIPGNGFSSPNNLQDTYLNTSVAPATIELNNTDGRIIIKDNALAPSAIDSVLFQVADGSGGNLFSVDVNPANSRHIKIVGNMSISNVLSTVNGIEFFPINANPGITSNNRTMWYSGPENRFKVGHAGTDRPIALGPLSVGGTDRIMKVSTVGGTHLLADTGLVNPTLGALNVPNRLVAVNINNNVAANNLIFGATNRSINSPAPSGPGGVLYFDGSDIIGVTDVPASGDILHYNGTDIDWISPATLGSSTNLQGAYDNFDGIPGAHIILTNTDGALTIRDDNPSIGTMIIIENGTGLPLLEIEDGASPTSAEIRITDNLSIGSPNNTNTGNILLRSNKFTGLGMSSLDVIAMPNSQGDGTIWVEDKGIDCSSKLKFTDFDPTGSTTNTFEVVLDTAPQIISNKINSDNYQLMNGTYTGTTTESGGIVFNQNAVNGTNNSNITGAFTITTVDKDNTHTFLPGDIILITNSCPDNNGLYEVISDSGILLTINNTPSESFLKTAFTQDSTSGGIITHVDISVLRVNTSNIWEIGTGNSSPINYNKLINRMSYMLFSNSVNVTSGTPTTIGFFPWVDSRYGTSGLEYKNGVLIFHLEIPSPGTTFDLDIRVVDSTESTTYASDTNISTSGIKILAFSSLPIADDFLQLQVNQSGTGPNEPIIRTAIFEFDY